MIELFNNHPLQGLFEEDFLWGSCSWSFSKPRGLTSRVLDPIYLSHLCAFFFLSVDQHPFLLCWSTFNNVWQVWTLLGVEGSEGGECPSSVLRFFCRTLLHVQMERVPKAVGSLPAACCAESNVCADHKPGGCSTIFKPRIPCWRTDRGNQRALKIMQN